MTGSTFQANGLINPKNLAEHFYPHAFWFNELFSQLVVPLRDSRSVCLDASMQRSPTAYRAHKYVFEDIDVILVEGIYLLKLIEIEAY